MVGFAPIGLLYNFYKNGETFICAVKENNSNDGTTTLVVVSKGPKNGKEIIADAVKLNKAESLGVLLPINGDIVIENGIEYVKVPDKGQNYQKKK